VHPLDSGLLLSGDDKNDGKLTVVALYDMRLPADLVTLSACNTVLGKVSSGDDVVGFLRGFLYAGASSIVSNLWQVDDQATAILMQTFYQSLPHMNKREALRAAQIKGKENL
jgi:CHAT domain-containing protein